MIRKRKVPALISAIALIAGCGSQTRAEVSGVVRDSTTGRVIAGARVVALDGSATRTDAEGRFTISVSRGLAREIRASAAGRCDASTHLDVRLDLVPTADLRSAVEIELAPCDDDALGVAVTAWDDDGAHDPDAVLRWIDDLELGAFAHRSVLEPEPDPIALAEAAEALAAEGHAAEEQAAEALATEQRARGVWGASEQWTLGSMSLDRSFGGRRLGSASISGGSVSVRAVGSRALGGVAEQQECATCHDGRAFASAHGMSGLHESSCDTCHEASPTRTRWALRSYERVELVAGAPAAGLGTGAICVDCHRSVASAVVHAPQSDVMLGRGARSVVVPRDAPHGSIADTCVSCHAATWREADAETLTLGHTFSTRGTSGGIVRDACSACHGDVEPETIARGDWDGDGILGAVGDEHDRASARAHARIDARIASARVLGPVCGGSRAWASSFAERDGSVWLVDADGVLLGDCDRDGWIGAREHGSTVEQLEPGLRDAVWDLALLERDGSRGVHNPRFAFAVLDSLAN